MGRRNQGAGRGHGYEQLLWPHGTPGRDCPDRVPLPESGVEDRQFPDPRDAWPGRVDPDGRAVSR